MVRRTLREQGIDLAAVRRCCSLRAIAAGHVVPADAQVKELALELEQMRLLLAKACSLLYSYCTLVTFMTAVAADSHSHLICPPRTMPNAA